MRAISVSALGDGILWPLLDDEGSMSFLFVHKGITEMADWLVWARNPVTWRTRFPGEAIGITVPHS